MRFSLLLLALASVFVLVTGCSSAGQSSTTPNPTAATRVSATTPQEPAPTATGGMTRPAATPAAAGQQATPQAAASPSGSAGNTLSPPNLTASAPSGAQQASVGAYFWVTPNGLAADVRSPGFTIQTPLELAQGDQVHFTFHGQSPQTVSLKVYRKDGNTPVVGSQSGAQVTAFHPQTDPVAGEDLSPTDLTWTATVAPGDYFVWLQASWPDKFKPDKPLTAEYAFTVTVK